MPLYPQQRTCSLTVFWQPSKDATETQQRMWRLQVKQEGSAVQPCTKEGSETCDLSSEEPVAQAQGVGPWRESSGTKCPSSLPGWARPGAPSTSGHFSTWWAMPGWQGPCPVPFHSLNLSLLGLVCSWGRCSSVPAGSVWEKTRAAEDKHSFPGSAKEQKNEVLKA